MSNEDDSLERVQKILEFENSEVPRIVKRLLVFFAALAVAGIVAYEIMVKMTSRIHG